MDPVDKTGLTAFEASVRDHGIVRVWLPENSSFEEAARAINEEIGEPKHVWRWDVWKYY